MFEVLTSWVIPSGVSTKSVMYFATGSSVVDARRVVNELWLAVADRLGTGVSWTIDTTCRVLDEETGVLTGLAVDTTSRSGAGTAAGLFVADATQVLLRWSTGVVVAGRFVQGRTYVPGLDANLLSNGNLSAGAAADFAAAASAFAGAGAGFGVWHRPKGAIPGTHLNAVGGSVNTELAVLRRRRNR